MNPHHLAIHLRAAGYPGCARALRAARSHPPHTFLEGTGLSAHRITVRTTATSELIALATHGQVLIVATESKVVRTKAEVPDPIVEPRKKLTPHLALELFNRLEVYAGNKSRSKAAAELIDLGLRAWAEGDTP